MSSCCTRRERRAPRLSRIAISRARSRARARKRLATFTHAMSSSMPTTAITTDDSATCAALNVGWTPPDCSTRLMPL